MGFPCVGGMTGLGLIFVRKITSGLGECQRWRLTSKVVLSLVSSTTVRLRSFVIDVNRWDEFYILFRAQRPMKQVRLSQPWTYAVVRLSGARGRADEIDPT